MKIASFRSRPRSPAIRQASRQSSARKIVAQWRQFCPGGRGACRLYDIAIGSSSGHATAQDLLALNHIQDASGIHTRDLLPEEKQVISKAVGLSIINPASAQYRWPQIANTEDGSINYCGMVNAEEPVPGVQRLASLHRRGHDFRRQDDVRGRRSHRRRQGRRDQSKKCARNTVSTLAGRVDPQSVRRVITQLCIAQLQHHAALALEPHNCALASRAPLTSASSFAQATVGWIIMLPAKVPNPQSAPAITRSRPTTLA